MRNLVVESLNEDFRPQVNLKDEMTYYTDMEDSLTDEGNEDLKDDFDIAIEEFGIDPEFIGVLNTYGADADWEDIKDELDKRQMEYYEFDTTDGESAILFDVRELSEETDE